MDLEYINMCRKAKDIQDYHFFQSGNIFFHIPTRRKHTVIQIRNELLCTELDALPINECIWLPTQEQLKEKIGEFVADVDDLFKQFCEDQSRTWLYPRPRVYFRSDEQRLLALLMAERFKKFWNKTRKDWFLKEDF